MADPSSSASLHERRAVAVGGAVVLALVSFIGTTAFMLMFRTREAETTQGTPIKKDAES